VRLGGTHDMTKGPDGLWMATIPPQVIGFHYYSIVIDGSVVADPATRTFFGSGWDNSGIEIPEPDADYYSVKDVPHGQVASGGITPKSPASGAAVLCTRLLTMTRTRVRIIRFFICSTGGAKTRKTGASKAMWTS